jgi:hypothetical protein
MSDPHDKRAVVVLTRLARFNAKVQGLVSGILLGGIIFLATNWLVLKGGSPVGPHLALLGQFFVGYRVSFGGSLIGLAYGFVTGFVAGYLLATLYNWFGARRELKGSNMHQRDAGRPAGNSAR